MNKQPNKDTEKVASPLAASGSRKTTPSTRNAQVQKRTVPSPTKPSPVSDDDALEEVLDELRPEPMMGEINTTESEPAAETVKSKNPFLFRSRRTYEATKKMSAMEQVCKKSGLSEDDIAMMLELGYETELGRMVGYENLKKLKQEHKFHMAESSHRHYRTAFGYHGEENVNLRTESAVFATYLYDRRFLLIRLLVTAFITALLFLFDYPALIGSGPAAFDESYPLVFGILSLVLLLGVSVLSWRQILAGFLSYARLKPTPYSSLTLLLPFAVLYDFLSFFTQRHMMSVNCIVAGVLLILALCDGMRLVGEMRVARLLCTDQTVTVLEQTSPRKKKLRQGKKLVKIINDDIDESFYRVQQAEETAGFFRRFNTMSTLTPAFQILLATAPAMGFVAAFITLLVAGSISAALEVCMIVLVTAAPISAILASFYPLFHANVMLTKRGCALIGEESVEEFSASKTLIFPDTELCTTERYAQISVQEGADIRTDLKLAGILFRRIGGPLASVAPPTSKAADPSVAFVRIAENGVEAIVDDRFHMIVGGADFLKKCGIRIPKETSDRALRRTAGTSIMYVAVDGVLKLYYEVEYGILSSFEALASDLGDIGTTAAVQSYDPNLSDAFLQNMRAEGASRIRVIKPGRYESDSTVKLSDTGAVAVNDARDIVHPVYAARGVRASRNFGIYLQYIASGLGALVATVLLLLPQGTLTGIELTPLTIAAYHIAGILVTLGVTQFQLNRSTLHLRRRDDNTKT